MLEASLGGAAKGPGRNRGKRGGGLGAAALCGGGGQGDAALLQVG